MGKFIDLTGQRFGKLVALERVPCPEGKNKRRTYWKCQCDCGKSHITIAEYLRCGDAKTCGCSHGEQHGLKYTTEYASWNGLQWRCENSNCKQYVDYGQRGITICPEWRHSFLQFLSDMGPKPSPEHSLERKNNNLGYSPDNCQWATRKEQGRNKRNNILVEIDSESKLLCELAENLGVPYQLLYRRMISLGWTLEESLTVPAGMRRKQYYKQNGATNGKETSEELNK